MYLLALSQVHIRQSVMPNEEMNVLKETNQGHFANLKDCRLSFLLKLI